MFNSIEFTETAISKHECLPKEWGRDCHDSIRNFVGYTVLSC